MNKTAEIPQTPATESDVPARERHSYDSELKARLLRDLFSQRKSVAELAAYACILLSYLLSYGILSAKGGYVYSCSGQSRYDFGLSFPDQLIWMPKGLYWERSVSIDGGHNIKCTFLGALYSPLISIDREWAHRDKKL